MKKILILTDHYPPHYRGAYELICRDVTEELRGHGFEVAVLTTYYGYDGPRVDGHVHRLLRFIDMHKQSGVGRRLTHLKLAYQALVNYRITRQFARQFNPDLVFVWNIEAASILPIFAVQDLGLPRLFKFGSHWLIHLQKEHTGEPSRLRRLYRSGLIGFRRFDSLQVERAIFVTESLRQSYEEAGFAIVDSITVTNSLDDTMVPDTLPPHERAAGDPFRLVFAGRLEEAKGPHIAVQAVAELARRGHAVALDLIGKGWPDYVRRIEKLIKKNKLEKRVNILGFMPREDLMKRLSTYDAMLFTSLQWEGQGMVVIEAMAQGVPSIAGDIGGPRDTIEDGEDGLLVPPGDPLALADAIEKLILAPDYLAQLRQNAFDAVHRKYRHADMIDTYLVYINSILAS